MLTRESSRNSAVVAKNFVHRHLLWVWSTQIISYLQLTHPNCGLPNDCRIYTLQLTWSKRLPNYNVFLLRALQWGMKNGYVKPKVTSMNSVFWVSNFFSIPMGYVTRNGSILLYIPRICKFTNSENLYIYQPIYISWVHKISIRYVKFKYLDFTYPLEAQNSVNIRGIATFRHECRAWNIQ